VKGGMDPNLRSKTWPDWTLFGVRWVFFIAISALIEVPRIQSGATDVLGHIALPLIITVIANVVFAIFVLYPQIHRALPAVIMLGDWAITASFLSITPVDDIPLTIAVVGLILISGLLRLGALWGAIEAIGVFAATLIALNLKTQLPVNILLNEMGRPLLVLGLLAVVTGVWSYILNHLIKDEWKRIEERESHRSSQLTGLRRRTHAIYEMATKLATTLDYEKILNAALEATDSMSLNQGKWRKGHIASVALLFRAEDNQLQVITGRGLAPKDRDIALPGASGILGKTLTELKPTFGNNASKDPELQYFRGFQGSRSVLCIPLRANYETYGVLLYGCEAPNAFDDEYSDLLMAIGIQATVALQNAALYNNLMDERSRIIEVEKKERDKLARDLHDGPTQDIAVIAMKMGIIARMLERTPDEVPSELKKVEELARRTTKVIRHMLFLLRPQVLENQGLLAALEDMAKKMEETYNQPMAVRISWDAERVLNDEQKNVIFQIVQEASNNARKHAQAELISVNVEQRDDVVIAEISDNGVGFEVDSVTANYDQRGSYGMLNLRERTELIGGSLQIKSAVGKGTTITIVVPIKQTTRADGRSRPQGPMTKLDESARRRVEASPN
jgi:signal transduction histidine kinase